MRLVTKGLLALTCLSLVHFAAHANTDQVLKCSSINDSVKRLACFDKMADALQEKKNQEAKSELAVADQDKDSPWDVSIEKSRMDDSTSVFLTSTSLDAVPGRLRYETVRPTLTIRCLENTTSMYIHFDGLFMTDSRGYGDVTFRVDKNEAFTRELLASTNRKALGLWRGGSAIPLIKSLFGGKELLIRATPYGKSPVTFSIDITGIEEAVEPLRKACNW